MAKKMRVGINGYGVIGKRVADAVRLQPDMDLIGVSDVLSDYRVATAAGNGIPLYASTPESSAQMSAAGISVAGGLPDLLNAIDVVVDCTPAGIGAENLEHYRSRGVKAIFQGGEKHTLTGHSFVAHANFAAAVGRDTTRVVSCNTTSTVRTLTALKNTGLLAKARGVLIRRATDPWESDHSGIMNTIVPERKIPSHQGPDAQSVDPDLDVVTMAAKGAHTQNHLHYWVVELTRSVARDDVLEALRACSRIAFVRESDGVVAPNSTIELMRDLGRPRGDMYEVALWEDILTVDGTELYYSYTVDNQAIVIPENIDAIRAVTGTIVDAAESIRLTDATLGIRRNFLPEAREVPSESSTATR
ncbi:type II glyceraldehyde-3-phosphate dehydrogenase [Rhodococcus ruber]|uniref:Glyceraldehyde-3-phosphate dehydrogenase n=1 Tax=Rhodococcus ruber TaxID=1830 RepID=A0A098BN60_9NOCA|nr:MULTISPECIES: type II glyceraldehyde-3-phosphate dehydrogenase [Rhodococcus]AUM19315.1 type II glyceraldehyde-3-phosphate dehydrogenase [Rhodococcus ruber]AXY49790.1 NAD(P)-dependent glyceraldehyde 3-phosphate dehydrogenase archaeal [Rhodococcus ruber]MBD8054845.1 type II glyceraldehyde-3-phosphate dehydrogenase [Rhodococcus ruber]MBP2214308.1 glyceraldehyde-3-phosphate dehydrogenase (NAD(P)) [Rhodococcus ruber]MCD2129804.1 type II glyceraldehyde-3-phosphate dehydrogenase [Rhodococcus ruber